MKMKKFINPENGDLYIVGATADIKAIYKSIARNYNTEITPYYNERPIFSSNKQMYAVCIFAEFNMTVINSDTMLAILMDGGLKEVK